jgi:hypothetical protein
MLVSSYRELVLHAVCASHMMSRHVEAHSALLGGEGARAARGCLNIPVVRSETKGTSNAPHTTAVIAAGLYHVHIYARRLLTAQA